MKTPVRSLIVILEDQLDPAAAWRKEFNSTVDVLWMAEPATQFRTLWAHKQRIGAIIAAMRAFRNARQEEGARVRYHALPAGGSKGRRQRGTRGAESQASVIDLLTEDLSDIGPERVVVVTPGSWHIRNAIRKLCTDHSVPLRELEDTHFYDSPSGFAEFMEERSSPLLEHYYRRLRSRTGILMDESAKPLGGSWNFDKENRKSFGKEGPSRIPAPPRFPNTELRREVTQLVEQEFAEHPGSIDLTLLPATPEEAATQLDEFVQVRLPLFGDFQDAMWTGAHFLYHSRLSAALNFKLINPRAVIDAALDAYHGGTAPLNAVEGFVRQVLGWREYVRGIYWHYMPEYESKNSLGAMEELPSFFWDGRTDMACVADAMANLLQHGYAHHIQRLMVLGLFSLLYGTEPRQFHRWHLAMYPDAHDWVSLPNAMGMSQHADGGIVGTKPYCASGAYIKRMSNYCRECRYDPHTAVGEKACPFTTLYWGFLHRHRERFSANKRMMFQIKNLDRKSGDDLAAITERDSEVRDLARKGSL